MQSVGANIIVGGTARVDAPGGRDGQHREPPSAAADHHHHLADRRPDHDRRGAVHHAGRHGGGRRRHASVTWVNNRGGSGTATGTTSWTATDIPLAGGANIIAVTAPDTSGNRPPTRSR